MKARRHPLPTFLIIGAAKSATTSLHAYVGQHPDVMMSPVKEPNFFAFEGGVPRFEGPAVADLPGLPRWYRRDPLRWALYQHSITRWRDYRRLFRKARGARAVGESSVITMYRPVSIPRIEQRLPDVKLLAILRHPAERAYSMFCHFRRDGLEPLADFESALAAEAERMQRGWSPTWFYVDRGFYHRQLSPFYEQFGADRIRVVLYDDLVRAPEEVLQGVFDFLGLDPSFVPDVSQRHNVSRGSKRPRSPWVDALLNRPNPVKALAKGMVDDRARRRRIRQWILGQVALREPQPAAMRPQTRRRLTETFRDDITRLAALIGRDLTVWLDEPLDSAGSPMVWEES